MLERAEHYLLDFPHILRQLGVRLDPTRVNDFLKSVKTLPLESLDDLYWAGRLSLPRSQADLKFFDQAFDIWAQGYKADETVNDEGEEATEETPEAEEDETVLEFGAADNSGLQASKDKIVGQKTFAFKTKAEPLAQLCQHYAPQLPRLIDRRKKAAKQGKKIDFRRTADASRRYFGEPIKLRFKDKPLKPRRILLLIDVSGSLKAHSEFFLQFAHALYQHHPYVEVFCFGTMLSHISPNLKPKQSERALASLASSVFDFDGGTRIGEALQDLLRHSSYSSMIRGALSLIISDGLERGDPEPMVNAVKRLSSLSYRLAWLNPLMASPSYEPKTRAMQAILPHLDVLQDCCSLKALENVLQELTRIDSQARFQVDRLYRSVSAA